MKFVLPPKKLLLVIFFISLLNPINYALLFVFPPEGKVFLGYPDDALMLTLMKSLQRNFDDPWSFDGGKVWHNPLIGSIFLFILLGILPLLLKIDLYLSFIFFKFLFSVIYYVVVYNLICLFMKSDKERKIAILVFMFVAGLGGILYILSSAIFPGSQYNSIIGYAFTNEFNELSATGHSLTHTFRLYYMIPELLGYLSLLFYLNRKKLFSGLMLGLVFLFYPTYGIAFSLVILIYELLFNKNFADIVKKAVPVYLIAGIFTLPWVISALERPYYYRFSPIVFENLPTINILIGLFFMVAFSVYYLHKNSFVPQTSLLVSGSLIFILFLLKQLYEISLRSDLFRLWLSDLGFLDFVAFLYNYSLLIDIAMIVVGIVALYSISKKKFDINQKFIIAWVSAFMILSGISPDSLFRMIYTGRQAALLLFPLSILATLGLIHFSKSVKRDAFLIVSLVVILSLSSLAGYNLWLQKSVRESGISGFFTQDEYTALKVLEEQEYGNVISSLRFGFYIPFYTGKMGLLFTGRVFDGYLDEVHRDYNNFYSSTDEERMRLIKKYKIKYVIFGRDELSISKFNPESANYLEKIYDGETKIYKING